MLYTQIGRSHTIGLVLFRCLAVRGPGVRHTHTHLHTQPRLIGAGLEPPQCQALPRRSSRQQQAQRKVGAPSGRAATVTKTVDVSLSHSTARLARFSTQVGFVVGVSAFKVETLRFVQLGFVWLLEEHTKTSRITNNLKSHLHPPPSTTRQQ